MDLTWTIEYAVQVGRARIVSFIWLLPLTGLGTTESGIDCRVIGVVTITSTFVSVASELAVAIFGLGGARVICCILLRASQLSSPAQKRVMRLVSADIVLGFS